MSSDQERFWQDHQRRNNEAFRREAEQRLRAQQDEQHRRAMEQQRRHREMDERQAQGKAPDNRPGEGTHPVVLYFGLIGALFGGVLRPWGWHWAMGAFFGFVAAGMTAGFLKESRTGRILLAIVGLGFAALVAAAILRS